MIITCPHCQTKYQVTFDAIGSAGRKVQCAHCHQAWQQGPLDAPPNPPVAETVLGALEEDALDEAFAAAAGADPGSAERMQQVAEKAEMASQRQQQRQFNRRQNAVAARLPHARLRRTARLLGIVALAGTVGLLFFGRVEMVRRYPAMAGLYENIGLPINVVGLDFEDVQTLHTLQDGKDLLLVSAEVIGLEAEPVPVPPVVVTLLDGGGSAIYEWSLTPSAHELKAGERAIVETQLTEPPDGASQVRLSFEGYSDRIEAADSPEHPSTPLSPPPEETHAAPPEQEAHHSDPEH